MREIPSFKHFETSLVCFIAVLADRILLHSVLQYWDYNVVCL